ncbi:MAG: IniB N-terminal domain-containing protein [Kibdelosporangium sp.]
MVYDEAPAAPAAPAPAAPAAGEPTLHDFVLNLLQDASAMKAFDLDPEGCLKGAGLTDITPADVHDVIPLVTDLVPTAGLPGLDAVPSLDSLPVLDGLPSVPGVPSLDDLTSGLALDAEAHGENGGWQGQFVGDSGLGGVFGGLAAGAGLDGLGTDVTAGVVDTALGDFDLSGGLAAGAERVAGVAGVNADTVLGSVNVSGAFDSNGTILDTGVHADSVLGDHFIDIDANDGLGSLELSQSVLPGVPAVGTGDLARGLADPTAAASALVGAVPALPALPAIPGLPQLPISDLPLPAVPELPVELPVIPALPVGDVGEVIEHAQDTVTGVVDGGLAGTLPDLGDHLPNVGGLLPNLPVELPNLPVHLPQLPIEVPQLPTLPVGDVLGGNNPVGDIVNHTGLGNVINNNPVTDTVHDVLPDLHLGL